MPQVVDAFVQGKTYQEIDMVKRNILALYEEDLGKYDDENNEKATAIFKAPLKFHTFCNFIRKCFYMRLPCIFVY